MIHFFDPSNPKMIAKVPDLAPKVDVLLGNLEDAVAAENKQAARAGLVEVAKSTDLGGTQLWTRVNSLDSPWVLDDLVTLVSQAPPWEKDRSAGVRILLRAIGEGKANAPDQILQRWTWKLAKATRKVQDRRASAQFPEAKRLLGAVANSRGHRHEENVARLVQVAKALPLDVGAALLASADGYTPRANSTLDRAREELGPTPEVANGLADNLPAPKAPAKKARRRRKRKKGAPGEASQNGATPAEANGSQPGAARADGSPSASKRRRRRRKPAAARADGAPPAPPSPSPSPEG